MAFLGTFLDSTTNNSLLNPKILFTFPNIDTYHKCNFSVKILKEYIIFSNVDRLNFSNILIKFRLKFGRRKNFYCP